MEKLRIALQCLALVGCFYSILYGPGYTHMGLRVPDGHWGGIFPNASIEATVASWVAVCRGYVPLPQTIPQSRFGALPYVKRHIVGCFT